MAEPDLPLEGAPIDVPASAAGRDAPVSAPQRIVALDFVRGVAILGILFANITAFSHSMLAYYWPGMLPDGGNKADGWVWLFQLVAVDGKFRGLFTLLFGAGMALFIDRVRARGGSSWLQARRLLWLGAFGLLHFYLLFVGDILVLYAVSGLVTLGLMWMPGERLIAVGLLWYIFGSLFLTLALGWQAYTVNNPASAKVDSEDVTSLHTAWDHQVEEAQAETKAMQSPDYSAIVTYRLEEESSSFQQLLIFAGLETIPLILIGMGLYRFGLFDGGIDMAPLLKTGWIFLGIGSFGSAGLGRLAFSSGFEPFLTQFVFNGASAFPRLMQMIGLLLLLTVWAPNAANGWLGSRIVAAGRMAFSNYIGTSIVMMFVFQGFAGGLFGKLHRLELLPFVFGGWLLMLAWSKPWLTRFRFGPLEWLWRCLTYWTIFPLRRAESESA